MKPTEELQPASCAWRGGRGSLVALLVVGFATAALVAVFNFYGFENAASMASAGSGEHGLGPTVALEQQRNAQMLEEILSVLRTKSFISAANATEEGVESPLDDNNETADLKETEKLLQRAEELLAEKLLQEHEHTDNTNTDGVLTNDNHHNKRPIDPLERFPANHDGSQIHIVFSMSCNHRNRVLQEIVLQLTATWAGQTGPITQILSDCSEEDREKVLLEPTFYYDFRRHFTPNFAANPEPGSDDWYAAYNKPFGLRHFLLNADPPVQHEILALIDGDFYFFRPIEVNTGRDVSRYYSGKRDIATVNDTVMDGLAVAQDWTNVNKDGFYLDERREMLDSVCAGLPCGNVSREDAIEYYANVGPPYIMTVNDVRRMVDDYCHLCVTSRKVSKEWMTEMFAYSVAVANNGIKHTALTNLGITSPGYSYDGREYWGFVDETMANPCEDNLEYVRPKDPPMTMHTCQWIHNYYKGLIPETIANCESPMLKNLPPSEWTDIDANVEEDRRHIRRQEVWGKCSIIKLTNRALLELKQRTCPQGFNTFRNVTAVNLG